MRVLIDIGHPAHVHFFSNPIKILVKHGHEILITSRDKEVALELLDEFGLEHRPLSALKKGGLTTLAKELILRNIALYKVVKSFHPDIMAAIGGTSIAQVGTLTRTPSLVFYDTENARLQNLITYPFSSCVIVPECYESWIPKRRHLYYKGYHELSYLHPDYFIPDKKLAIKCGLSPDRDTFLIRTVSWQASHDVNENGWNETLLKQICEKLSSIGRVIISSEVNLDQSFAQYQYTGNVSHIHHLMSFCRAYIGESATMASECAVLGIPAIYAAQTGRGYTNEQECSYGLVKNIRSINWEEIEKCIDEILELPIKTWKDRQKTLLAAKIDVAKFVADCIESYPNFQTANP